MSFQSAIKLGKGFGEIRKELEASITPFGKCTEKEKRERKFEAETHLKKFAETYFPHYTEAPFSKMHLDLFKEYEQAILESEETGQGKKTAKAAPRGNAKSTITTLILPLWCIATRKRKFIGLISDTVDQADEFLEFIKAELEINQRLKTDFPDACGEGTRWKIGHIVTANGVKVRCWGKGKRIRGARHGSRRPDLMILDDLEDDESVESPEQRRKNDKWFFKAVMKVGDERTVFIVIGTILHYDSLLARLLKQPGWSGKKYQAVIAWAASPLWELWENLFIGEGEKVADEFFAGHQKEMLEGAEVLWPEKESYYFLMKMRVSDGPAFFDSEKQNEPVNPEDCLFQEEWFEFIDEEQLALHLPNREYKAFYAAVDPSMGKKGKGDPSAILIGGVLPSGLIDVLEADIKKRHPDAIMEALFAYHAVYPLTRAVIEEVQFQEYFKDQVLKEGARRGIYLPIQGTRPVSDKTLRIQKLQPHIKNGLIRFRKSDRILLDQLKYFPKADHDDGPDALEMLFTLIAEGGSGPRIRRVA